MRNILIIKGLQASLILLSWHRFNRNLLTIATKILMTMCYLHYAVKVAIILVLTFIFSMCQILLKLCYCTENDFLYNEEKYIFKLILMIN